MTTEPARSYEQVHGEVIAAAESAIAAALATAENQQSQSREFLSGGLDSDIPFGAADAPST